MNHIREDIIRDAIIRDAEHLERKLRKALEARLGENFDIKALKGRCHRLCSPTVDSYYLDGELLFHYARRKWSKEFWCGS